jgi:hypothetical protein
MYILAFLSVLLALTVAVIAGGHIADKNYQVKVEQQMLSMGMTEHCFRFCQLVSAEDEDGEELRRALKYSRKGNIPTQLVAEDIAARLGGKPYI